MKDRHYPTPRSATSETMRAAPGVHCWVTGRKQIPLPKELREHERALGFIIGHEGRDWLVVAMNKRWQLEPRQFDLPERYRNRRGVWVPEWHPSVERYLRFKLDEARAWRGHGMLLTHRQEQIARYKWYLRRNGWQAEDLPADGYED